MTKTIDKKRGTGKRLFKMIFKVSPWGCVAVCVFIIISAFASAYGSMFIKSLIDDHIEPLLLESEPVFSGLLSAIAMLAAVFAAGVISSLLFNRMMVVIAQKTLMNIRNEMFAHMQALPVKYYDTHSHGNIMSLYTNDADTLREFISQSLSQILSGIVTVVVMGAFMVVLSPVLCILVLVCVILILIISRVLSKTASKYFRRQQQKIGGLNGYVEEMLNGQKVVKVFCHESAAIDGFNMRNDSLCADSIKANRAANLLMPVIMQLGTIQYILLALFGGYLAINGIAGVTIGTVGAFLVLSKSFSAPIGQVSSQVNVVVSALAGAGRIFGFLDETYEQDNGYITLVNAEYRDGVLCETQQKTGVWAWKNPRADEGCPAYTQVRGEVCFYNVDFGYNAEKTILHNISITAKTGQKIAFVGATGAGKTTITNLLNRFYDIADGTITYDGINISDIKKDDLRRSLGIVLQDTHLFSGTIADNIRYGKIDATTDEVINAALLANAHDFIMRLPDGYDTYISGSGANLSGGQRQLIAIARAAIADPPVMILDEATSSIDTRTESLVQRGMDGLMQGRTVFVIAHRLSTVKNSDLIIVLEQGKIIEKGNHDELIAQKGKYHQLYTGGLAD